MNPDPNLTPATGRSRKRIVLALGLTVALGAIAGTAVYIGRAPVAGSPAAATSPFPGVVCHGTHYTLTAEIHAGS